MINLNYYCIIQLDRDFDMTRFKKIKDWGAKLEAERMSNHRPINLNLVMQA